ncbi:ubiquitin-like-specific protease ESD4 [Selaginella moellendorffii]|uniref:ubiquitin-like-specific protease ESD4 n=1 Tax=Selaginella moellendorffii TaxID=88036 RepID=UPI000D1C6206|nr:ubiquitin-like-specific protease ESD4 [Selaginella moellendorffii]|eukprot:XP_002970173.2 ubiquitin-like-specific protease ESD4 [Selaginella moellendorffii]
MRFTLAGFEPGRFQIKLGFWVPGIFVRPGGGAGAGDGDGDRGGEKWRSRRRPVSDSCCLEVGQLGIEMEYRRRSLSMHGLRPSRSLFKRNCDMATLERLDKRMIKLITVDVVRDIVSQRMGLKAIDDDWRNDHVVKRNYTVRSTPKNREVEDYARRVAAGTPASKASSNLQKGPTTFSMGCGASTSDGVGSSSSSQIPKWLEIYNGTKSSPAEQIDREATLTANKLKELHVTKGKLWEESDKKKRQLLKKQQKPDVSDAFTRLSDEEERAVESALYSKSRQKVLVMHEQSNIEITGAVMECLRPGTWLNDEVINLYMELLKEREIREPKKFLRCHFFNTFFYNKLFKDKDKYDYKAVRRWTTQKKLGYSLLDCDKIFVPIHKDIHWCLAIINIRDQKFEYLDSLSGIDEDVLEVLSNYIADEAKDKLGKSIDVSGWGKEYPEDIPGQENGCDCGMFMIKYADFYSRGSSLPFTQGDMEYFRRRTVWEILRLKAT